MLRRDYILRMVAEFFEALSRIRSLKNDQQWVEASQLTDAQLQKLIGMSSPEVAQLSETELLARLIRGESSLAVREKTLMLVALLKEAGDTAANQHSVVETGAFYLKALHLLLGVFARDEASDCPEFVPKVEVLTTALNGITLPLATQAMLMQHYERLEEFAKAEDRLFSMLDIEPGNRDLIQFGIAFYRRLLARSDDALITGNLPRTEIEAGLSELLGREESQAALAKVLPQA
jgi:hypothetical protein